METGIGLFLSRENGIRSLGLGFDHWEWKKCQNCGDISYFQIAKRGKHVSNTLFELEPFHPVTACTGLVTIPWSQNEIQWLEACHPFHVEIHTCTV